MMSGLRSRDRMLRTTAGDGRERARPLGLGPAVIVPAICLLMLVGCGRVKKEALVVGLEGGMVGMDPHRQDEAVTVSVLANIYEGLVAFDSNLKVVPALAEGYSNPDDLTWRFHLRKGVSFHDGRSMSAGDVAHSISRAWRDSGSIFRGMLSGIDQVRVVGPHTVEVATRRPQPTMINILTQVAVIPEGSRPDSVPIGTGPYRFVSMLPERGVRLERFDGGWRPRPQFRVVEFRNIANEGERAAALLKGEIDVDASVSEGQRRMLESAEGVGLTVCPSATVGVLGFNVSGPPAANPVAHRLVRRAISLAVDRERLSAEAYHGFTRPAWQLVPPTVVGYDPDMPRPGRNIDEARSLLRRAGFADSLRLTLEMAGSAWPVGKSLMPQLAEAGIALRVDTVSWEDLYRDIYSGKSRFFFMGFAFGFGDASEVLNELHSRTPGGMGSNNVSGYSNPALDGLLVAADREFDPAKRRELLKRAGRIAAEDLPYVPLYIREYCYGMRKGLAWMPRSDGLVLAAEFRRK